MNYPIELKNLVDYESTILDYHVDPSHQFEVQLKYTDGRKNYSLQDLMKVVVMIKVKEKEFSSKMDRPFIHQIGGRIWKNERTYIGVAMEWLKTMNDGGEILSQLIKQVFIKNNLVIRYDPENYKIYGIVTNIYSPSDQLKLREHFVLAANKTKLFDTTNSKIDINSGGNIEERFLFNNPSQSVQLECTLVYGKNTGYNSYKTKWHRKSLDDGMWFSTWESNNKYEWRNNSKSGFVDYVEYIFNEGLEHQKFLEERVKMAKEKNLQEDFLNFFMNRMLIAYATKDRIRNQYTIDTKQFGKTVWALSHSLRFIGSSNAIAKKTQWLLQETGTLIFEKSYKDYLESHHQIKLSGSYVTY